MQNELTHGPVMKTMLRFAVPMILGDLLQQCYNIADTLIVGRYLGADALAAVGSAFSLMTFLTTLSISSFVSVIPSYGSRQFKKSAILSGFRIVVEKDRGLYFSLAIVRDKYLLRIFFDRIVVKTDIIAVYIIDPILFGPLAEGYVCFSLMCNQIRDAEFHPFFMKPIQKGAKFLFLFLVPQFIIFRHGDQVGRIEKDIAFFRKGYLIQKLLVVAVVKHDLLSFDERKIIAQRFVHIFIEIHISDRKIKFSGRIKTNHMIKAINEQDIQL